MTREETFNSLCVLIEDYVNASDQFREFETLAEQILDTLEITGEELLDHLDPPVGLRRWLDSHGLSLVVTREITPPVVWDAIQGEDEEDEVTIQEGEPGESLPLLEVGGLIEYRTAPSGPRNQSYMGSGRITAIQDLADGLTVIVETGPGQEVWIDPVTDFIRVVSP